MKVCEEEQIVFGRAVAQLGRAGETSRAIYKVVDDLESQRSGRIEGALHRSSQTFKSNLAESKLDTRSWMAPNSKVSV